MSTLSWDSWASGRPKCERDFFAGDERVEHKLYEVGRISQELAGEIAGLPRAEFIRAVSQLQVSPFQDTADSLKRELKRT